MRDKTQLEQIVEAITEMVITTPLDDIPGTGDIYETAEQILDICQPQCEWKMTNDGFYDVWESTCGNSFVLNEGSPEDNEMNYCSHCGGKLIQSPPEDTA